MACLCEVLRASSVIAAIVMNFLIAACSHEDTAASNLEVPPHNPGSLYSYWVPVPGAALGAPIGFLKCYEDLPCSAEDLLIVEAAIGADLENVMGRREKYTSIIPSHASRYSLFLICNPEWIRKLADDINEFNPLYRNYIDFGEAIGQNHLAIWFWEIVEGRARQKERAVDILRYDVDRAVGYCSKYKLTPSRSPYVLVTTSYPDSESVLGNYFTVELGDLDEKGSLKMLSALADQVLLENITRRNLTALSV